MNRYKRIPVVDFLIDHMPFLYKIPIVSKILDNREIFTYILFGVLTTVINYVLYFMFRWLGSSWFFSNFFSWLFAVLFAYITNKIYVFISESNKITTILYEIFTFFSGRGLTLFVDMFIMYVGIDLLKFENYEWLVKIISQVVVIVSNYFIGKYLVFKKK